MEKKFGGVGYKIVAKAMGEINQFTADKVKEVDGTTGSLMLTFIEKGDRYGVVGGLLHVPKHKLPKVYKSLMQTLASLRKNVRNELGDEVVDEIEEEVFGDGNLGHDRDCTCDWCQKENDNE